MKFGEYVSLSDMTFIYVENGFKLSLLCTGHKRNTVFKILWKPTPLGVATYTQSLDFPNPKNLDRFFS